MSSRPPGAIVLAVSPTIARSPHSRQSAGVLQQPLGFEPFAVVKPRGVLVPAIAEDRDDRVPGAEVARDTNRGRDIGAAGGCRGRSLPHAAARRSCGRSPDPRSAPHRRSASPARLAVTRPMPMPSVTALEPDDFSSPCFTQWCRALPIGSASTMRTARLLLLQIAGNATERAAGSGGAGERIDASLRITPDFGAGGPIVRVTICGVVELVADGRAKFLGHPRRELLVVIRVGVGHGLHDAHFGTQRAQQRCFLRRLVVGHHDHALVAACIAEVRKADAGVARSAFDERAARRDLAAALGVIEDAAGGAILDGAARDSGTRPCRESRSRWRRLRDAGGSAACCRSWQESPSRISWRIAVKRYNGSSRHRGKWSRRSGVLRRSSPA